MKKSLCVIFLLATFCNILPCDSAGAGLEESARDATAKGWRYFNIGDHDTALKRFRQATILDPDFAPGYYGVGYIYSLRNRLGLAIKYYRKAIELADPPDSHAYGNLGLALIKSGQEQEGFLMVQKALEIDPDNGEAHLSLAGYYCSEKNGSLARGHLETAEALGARPGPRLIEEMKTRCP